jgi:hypothetical protein
MTLIPDNCTCESVQTCNFCSAEASYVIAFPTVMNRAACHVCVDCLEVANALVDLDTIVIPKSG